MERKRPARGRADGRCISRASSGTAGRGVQGLDAAEIARALGGRRCGSGWIACCPAHDDREPSLSIAEGANGRVLVHCHAGCAQDLVIEALRRRGLWRGRDGEPDPVVLAEMRRQVAEAVRREEASRIARARAVWQASRPVEPGDPVDRYLRGRGLAPPPAGWPPTLRTGRDDHGPLLVAAAARWPGREVVAVQVTRLTSDGRKRPVEIVRLTYGLLRGAAVRLAPWQHDRTILLVEGVEDAIASLMAWPEASAWAVLGAANAARVAVPPGSDVMLCLDGDAAGRSGAEAAARELVRVCRRVRIARVPEGTDPASLVGGAGNEAARPMGDRTGRDHSTITERSLDRV